MTLSFAPDQIEMWPLAKLQPYARNAKAHGADQVAKIAASMAEFGWTVPCLVGEDGELIAGHGRVLAATQLGLTEAPVIVLGHMTEAQRRAYRIADNKLTELGTWDEALLSAELIGLLASAPEGTVERVARGFGGFKCRVSGLDRRRQAEGHCCRSSGRQGIDPVGFEGQFCLGAGNLVSDVGRRQGNKPVIIPNHKIARHDAATADCHGQVDFSKCGTGGAARVDPPRKD
jgi:hypothetical protein